MKYQELLILLPCHSLEDFPTFHEGDDAESLLASWSALWHPQLIAAAGQAPRWQRVDDPPGDVRERLIVVPTVSTSRLPTGFAQRVKDEGGVLIRKTLDRGEIVAAALAPLTANPAAEPGTSAPPAPPLNSDLAADFLALGYCYLQVELLTRQMRYSSNLDETYFQRTAVAAAEAAVAGDEAAAREKLGICFSLLAEERDHYYPVDAFILDLNLTAATTLGEPLARELASAMRTNLLLSGDLLTQLAAKEPATLAELKRGLEEGRVGLIGGEAVETRLPLLSLETIVRNLQAGLAMYDQHLGRRPLVFGRWRYGPTPNLPGILHKLGFRGALHTGFEEGQVPDGLQFKVRWEGLDGSAIDAIAKTPLDASKPQTFLALATRLGESMDSDHVATLALAHWPGQACQWLGDLRRIARYSAVLGKWVTVDEYFEQTDQPGQLDRFEGDRYRSPYFKQAIIRKQDDPLSSQARYWQRQAAAAAAQTLHTLAAFVQGTAGNEPNWGAALLDDEAAPSAADAAADAELSAARDRLAAALAAAGAKGPRGCLILNPGSIVRRIGAAELPLAALPAVARPVYSADSHASGGQVVADVPAFGFVHVTPGGGAPQRDRQALLLADEGVLRNEFFEAIINPTTGSLAAIHEYKSRGNRLSQQLALRAPAPRVKPGDTQRDEDESALYSVMAADSVETTISTSTLGEIVARGRLLDRSGTVLARFTQTYRLWRGSRVLHLSIALEPLEEPQADPWNSYYCCRFAWSDEAAELWRTVNQARQSVTEKRFEAPHYIDIGGDIHRTTILTGGLPFHRRHGDRMLDTLLVARGERQRTFRLGIGVDLAHPMHEAVALFLPPLVVPDVPQPASGSSGWLLHLSSRNVLATSLRPLVEGSRVAGFRVRLLETAGRPANLSVTALRAVQSAAVVDFEGRELADCRVEEGKIKLDLAANEWVEIAARW